MTRRFLLVLLGSLALAAGVTAQSSPSSAPAGATATHKNVPTINPTRSLRICDLLRNLGYARVETEPCADMNAAI